MAARTLGPTKKHREIPNGISIIYQIFGFTAGFDALEKNFVWRMEMPGMERFFTIFATKTNPWKKYRFFGNLKNQVTVSTIKKNI